MIRIPPICRRPSRSCASMASAAPSWSIPAARSRTAGDDPTSRIIAPNGKPVARQGDQEFANHSAHHRGAIGDEDMEAEIGDAAKAIWKLFPGKSKLMALNLGGGTRWETTRTLRYYLDKYHLFDASRKLDRAWTTRTAIASTNFRSMLEQHIERGLWYRIHYHYIGEGLSSSEANFRAVLDIAKEHEAALWIAGMADIHKYQTERNGSSLALVSSEPRRLAFRLSCLTDPELYDQPLTIEVMTPERPGRRSGSRSRTRRAKESQSERRRLAASQCGVSRLPRVPQPTPSNWALEVVGTGRCRTRWALTRITSVRFLVFLRHFEQEETETTEKEPALRFLCFLLFNELDSFGCGRTPRWLTPSRVKRICRAQTCGAFLAVPAACSGSRHPSCSLVTFLAFLRRTSCMTRMVLTIAVVGLELLGSGNGARRRHPGLGGQGGPRSAFAREREDRRVRRGTLQSAMGLRRRHRRRAEIRHGRQTPPADRRARRRRGQRLGGDRRRRRAD